MDARLGTLLDDPRVWRAGRHERRWPTLSSGYPALDALLPGGGWPAAQVTEIAVERWGSGELALLMPLLAGNGGTERGITAARWIAWISPPFLPYAPALAAAGVEPGRLLLVRGRDDAESLWAVEQALRSGCCRIVLAWIGRADSCSLRRLQLAAEAGQAPLVLFRPPSALATPSPAALRLRLDADDAEGPQLRLVKQRGAARNALPLAELRPQ